MLLSQSGKDDDGLKIIRYASKIVLQTKIQSQGEGKIYPPKLIIEYIDIDVTADPQQTGTFDIVVTFEDTWVQ